MTFKISQENSEVYYKKQRYSAPQLGQTTQYEGKRYHLCKTLSGRYPKYRLRETNKLFFKSCGHIKEKEVPDLEKEREYSVIDSLALPTDAPFRIREKCLSMAFSFKEYMEYALYDPTYGYYTTRPGIGTDFKTTPVTSSPFYGAALAEIIMKLWQGMVRGGSFRLDEKVDICELGAGTGVLARDLVLRIRKNAETKGGLWQQLYTNLSYKIGEISKELRSQQRETVSGLRDKIRVLKMDARKLDQALPKDALNGFILSNELPDAFSSHKIRKTPDGSIEVAIAVPVIIGLEAFLHSNKDFTDKEQKWNLKEFFPRIQNENLFLQNSLKPEYGFNPSDSGSCQVGQDIGYLSKRTYKLLRKKFGDKFFDSSVKWKEFWIPASSIPEVKEFCSAHTPFIERLPENRPTPLNTDLRTFQEGSGSILKKGMQITIDYQYDMPDLIKSGDYGFRTYPGRTLHDYSKSPGEEDITTDVNATALAVEGVRAQFEPFLFCSEEEMLSIVPSIQKEISLPQGGLPFYSLFMKKKGTLIDPSLPVLTKPVTYCELGLKQFDWTCSAIPNMSYVKGGPSRLSRKMYDAYKDLGPYPDFDKYKEVESEIVGMIPQKHEIMREIVRFLFFKLFCGVNPLFKVAKEFNSVSDFDYKRIMDYFITKTTTDNMDRTVIQMVRQLLQLYYSEKEVRTECHKR